MHDACFNCCMSYDGISSNELFLIFLIICSVGTLDSRSWCICDAENMLTPFFIHTFHFCLCSWKLMHLFILDAFFGACLPIETFDLNERPLPPIPQKDIFVSF